MPNLKEINSINNTLEDLVLISGLSGHETKVRDYLKTLTPSKFYQKF